MGGRIRVRKPLSMKRARATSAARHIIAQGLVDSGSEWDGWHIRDVYRAICPQCSSAQAAYDLVKAIWENRAAAYKAGNTQRGTVVKRPGTNVF